MGYLGSFEGKVDFLASFCGVFLTKLKSLILFTKLAKLKGGIYYKKPKAKQQKTPNNCSHKCTKKKHWRQQSQLATKEIPTEHNNRKELHMVKHQELPRDLEIF